MHIESFGGFPMHTRFSSRPLSAVCSALTLALLSACSSAPRATSGDPESEAQLKARRDATSEEYYLGSRLPRKSTDRLVRRTDNQGAKEAERDRPPSPGPISN